MGIIIVIIFIFVIFIISLIITIIIYHRSRKYPSPPTEGIFPMTPPPSPLDFPKSAHKMETPLPSADSIFIVHPLEILSFVVEI